VLLELSQQQQQAIRCPGCLGQVSATTLHCGRCAKVFPWYDAYLDLEPDISLPTTTGLGPLLLQDPLQIARYEDLTRPAFLRVAAANWADELTGDDERGYLHEHVAPVDGPIVDIACGAGRWTRVMVNDHGADRVIGLDLSVAMLNAIARALPDILRVRASAMRLPFADGSLGAVNCSAALQIMPDPGHVIAEIGRCLGTGGSFTLATLTQAPRPVQRYFQRRQEEVFNTRSFEPHQVNAWLDAAGLELVHEYTPACFLLCTARKR
jgi:SAM-dependent methyltransferase